jgi:lipopolysaccharide assembly protein A
MNFLKTAFWVILAVAIALFTKANWVVPPTYSGYIPVKLWGDIIIETRLPILIVMAFLLGLLPMWIIARASRWSLRRKLDSAERALASTLTPASSNTASTPPESGITSPQPTPPLGDS